MFLYPGLITSTLFKNTSYYLGKMNGNLTSYPMSSSGGVNKRRLRVA